MKKKIVIISAIFGVIILGIIIINIISLYSVRIIGGKPIGDIWKDANDNVTATIFVTLYNGTNDDKKIVFEVEGGDEYLKGDLNGDHYTVTNIEISRGIGQVDLANMVLTIPSHEKVGLQITAQNIYVGKNYQGEEIGLRKEPPNIKLFIIE